MFPNMDKEQKPDIILDDIMENQEKYDYDVSIMAVGNTGASKSSILNKISKEKEKILAY